MRINIRRAIQVVTARDASRIAERVRIRFRQARASNGATAMVPSDVQRLLAIAEAAIRASEINPTVRDAIARAG